MNKIKELKAKIEQYDKELDDLRIKVVMAQFNQKVDYGNLDQKREKLVSQRNIFVKSLLEAQDVQAADEKRANKKRRREEAEDAE